MKSSTFEEKMRKEKRKSVRKEKEEETETMDVYDEKQLEEMLENDEIFGS